jgi:hypothetical protein
MYDDKKNSRDVNEEKRIYTYTETTVDDILRDIHPGKYTKKDIKNDRSNLIKAININELITKIK